MMFQLTQNGNLDFIDSIPTAEIEAAKKTSEFYTVDNLGTYYVGFNINSKLYSELGLDADQAKVFRKAICLLIDRQYIIDTIAQGGQKIATTSQRALQMVTVASSRTKITTAQITIRTLRRLKSFLLLSDY